MKLTAFAILSVLSFTSAQAAEKHKTPSKQTQQLIANIEQGLSTQWGTRTEGNAQYGVASVVCTQIGKTNIRNDKLYFVRSYDCNNGSGTSYSINIPLKDIDVASLSHRVVSQEDHSGDITLHCKNGAKCVVITHSSGNGANIVEGMIDFDIGRYAEVREALEDLKKLVR